MITVVEWMILLGMKRCSDTVFGEEGTYRTVKIRRRLDTRECVSEEERERGNMIRIDSSDSFSDIPFPMGSTVSLATVEGGRGRSLFTIED